MTRNRQLTLAASLVLFVAGLLAWGRDTGTPRELPAPTPSAAAAGSSTTEASVEPPRPNDGAGPGKETDVVVFKQPLLLADVKDLAADHHGSVVALWRTEPVCVEDVMRADWYEHKMVSSAFAYYDADALVDRQNHGPPVTDGGWSFALRDRFKHEWQMANTGVALFAGAALVVPTGEQLRGGDVATVGPVESYRTDVVQVLYLQGHERAMAKYFPDTDTIRC